MSAQTTYNMAPAEGYDGQKYDLHPGTDDSRVVETAAIAFGRVVSQGSTDKAVVLGGSEPVGICVRELELEGGIPQVGDVIAVRSAGPLYATVDGAGGLGASLNVIAATGVLTTAAANGTTVLPTGRISVRLKRTKSATAAIVPVQIDARPAVIVDGVTMTGDGAETALASVAEEVLVDGVTITGDGVETALASVAEEVLVDGVTITGDGVETALTAVTGD